LKKVAEQHEHVALNPLLKGLGQRLHADAWISPPSILVKGQVVLALGIDGPPVLLRFITTIREEQNRFERHLFLGLIDGSLQGLVW
jgi:hypothetical protein